MAKVIRPGNLDEAPWLAVAVVVAGFAVRAPHRHVEIIGTVVVAIGVLGAFGRGDEAQLQWRRQPRDTQTVADAGWDLDAQSAGKSAGDAVVLGERLQQRLSVLAPIFFRAFEAQEILVGIAARDLAI